MINAPQLLADLKRRLLALEDDLRERINALPDLKAGLQAEWQTARDANRTAETFESWSDQVITQAGVHWLLSCVFLRFIEDNTLVERPWIGGTPESGRLALARDRADAYFREQPLHSDRDYLLSCFTEAGALPGLHTFFDPLHNPVFRLGISGDAAMGLRQFWQQVDPNTGALLHDFTDPAWNTRFLGDLYQDLSEATRKRYALLQTPEFVEEFILDRTLTPAILEFGYREVRMIDPTCGSGHFLLGGFARMVAEWSRAEPNRNRRDVAQKALDAVSGVDLNPFAVAISRFRLLVAALLASDVHKLSEAPDFHIHVAIGDSLLHGKRFGMTATEGMFEGAEHYAGTGLAHAYASEDLAEIRRILGRQYHAVVGNPPYIVVKDAVLNRAYRDTYASCHMKYSLGCPFTERFFDLAVTGPDASTPAGYVGLITTNSFMKREFGSKLIEEVLPRLDLSHVVDSSGAWIPGHNRDGTATVILFGRHRPPMESNPIRTVMGIRSEPGTPSIPADGLVWSAIVKQVDRVGSESDYISVADTPRLVFSKHPWSIGGGGAADLKELIELDRPVVKSVAEEVGITAVNGEDELFLLGGAAHASRLRLEHIRPMVTGDLVRDWFADSTAAVWLYDSDYNLLALESLPQTARYFWPAYSVVSHRKRFGTPMVERGLTWYEYQELYVKKLRTPLTITFGEVTTHNHFVLDRGVKVFNRTAPVIKLPAGRNENEYLGLLGLLNSSVACFWLKQVCFPKDGQGQMWEERFAFNATNVAEFPLSKGRPLAIASRMDALVRQLITLQPTTLLAATPAPTRASLDAAHARATQVRQYMIGEQEELDWHCYGLYELLPAGVSVEDVEHSTPVEVALGERAFEIVLARRIAAGKETSNWFERHGSTPTTEIPARWPESYQRVVQRRIDLIERDPTLKLLEQPLYKRRWNTPKWEDLEQAALREWLLGRLESKALWVASADQPPQISTTSRLADAIQRDAEFMQIAALYAGHADFELTQLVAGLVAAESVPFLPALRYSDAGLRKRAQWQDTWALQRREDKGESIGKIPVPPKYKKEDFLKVTFWNLRGGLDVPKERWVSYPGCERGADGSLPIAWAGWDHLQQATALAAYYLDMKDNEGWLPERLQPLLAGLLELVPWLEQWHNEVDPVYGERMGHYYKGFVAEEARELGFTLDDLRAYKPAATVVKRGRKKAD
jgi:hypothetical protein